MKVFYKLVFVDRKTREPAMKPKQVKPQFSIDIEELYRTTCIVNPPRGLAIFLPKEKDIAILIDSTAQLLSEMYGADVYYKPMNEKQWKHLPNVWKG